ncbi:MAG: hypothetical protein JWQ71_4343 [Pedosphaera sp.]|nr:hypothetical protein [Pedosphaera sp.]
MKVECRKIINELAHDEPPTANKERLTVGKSYDVLEVAFDHRVSMCWYRIECDDGKPWLILSTQFQIVSNKIPPNWIVSQYDGGIAFSPASWLPPREFWEKLFAGDTATRKTYEEEKQKMAT